MDAGKGPFSEGSFENNWGNWNDHSELGEEEDEANGEEYREIGDNFENLLFSSNALRVQKLVHNPEVVSSNLAPLINHSKGLGDFENAFNLLFYVFF